MDGRELAQRMLAHSPSMKVVLMSGHQVAGPMETGYTFIEKPFTIKELLQKVADTLKEGSRTLAHPNPGPRPS